MAELHSQSLREEAEVALNERLRRHPASARDFRRAKHSVAWMAGYIVGAQSRDQLIKKLTDELSRWQRSIHA